MNAYDKLKNALSSTGLYSLSNDSLVNAEILAYSKAIELFEQKLLQILGNLFIHLADENTLRKKADDMGLIDIPSNCLKPILLTLLRSQNCGVFKKDLEYMLDIIGYKTNVLYDVDTPVVFIELLSDNYEEFHSNQGVAQLINLISQIHSQIDY